MLVVKVELHPFSDPSNAQLLEEIIIANTGTSDDPSIGNYAVYKVKNGERLLRGTIKNHQRLKDSVWKLVKKAISAGGF
jgi:hypothetical protein